jgi:DNA replication protein DnaC
MALASGDSWIEKGATILIFGPPGVGKSHVGCGIGHALIDAGYRRATTMLLIKRSLV